MHSTGYPIQGSHGRSLLPTELGFKISQVSGEVGIQWKYCPSEMNLADEPGSTRAQGEEHPPNKIMLYAAEKKPDEWDDLLDRKPYWSTLRITAWPLQFVHNGSARMRKEKRPQGTLSTEEIMNARDHWVRREQKKILKPGWKLVKDEGTSIGRIENYRPTDLTKNDSFFPFW